MIGILRSSVASAASFELAVTMLSNVPPASSSACVKVCVAVQVVVDPASGATVSVLDPQLISSLSLLSDSDRPVIVTLPVFVTR